MMDQEDEIEQMDNNRAENAMAEHRDDDSR